MDRSDLVQRLLDAGRKNSTAAVMFHTALAAARGLSATEEKAIELLDRHGPLTHRQLAAASGLAPASVSGLVDRLERKGYARRLPNPDDGRSVLIELDAERALREFAPLLADWVVEVEALAGRYTDDQLAAIAEFLELAAERQRVATAKLTGG